MNEAFQVKELIKRAISIMGSSGAGITLRTADDCSLFISNIFNYQNWQDLKNSSKTTIDEVKSFNVEITDFAVKDFENLKDFQFKNNLSFKKQQHRTFPKTVNILKNNPNPLMDFAVSDDELLKLINIESIQQYHTTVVSNHKNAELSNRLSKTFKNESVISFGPEKNSISLDPWATMMKSNNLEAWFHYEDGFTSVFVQIIRDLQILGIRTSLKDMIERLKIENFISLFLELNSKKMPSSIYLNVLMKTFKISCVEGEIISVEQQRKYVNLISDVYNILLNLDNLYEVGAFKNLYGDDSLVNAMSNRENITLSDKYLDNPFYCQLLKSELKRAFAVYSKSIDGMEGQYVYWLMIDDLKKFDKFPISVFYQEKFLRIFVMSSIYADNLNSCLLNSEQFLIGKNEFLNFSHDVKDKLLGNVLSWPERFWHQNSTILNLLYTDEYYFIYPKVISQTDIEFRDFHCKKISVMKDE